MVRGDRWRWIPPNYVRIKYALGISIIFPNLKEPYSDMKEYVYFYFIIILFLCLTYHAIVLYSCDPCVSQLCLSFWTIEKHYDAQSGCGKISVQFQKFSTSSAN